MALSYYELMHKGDDKEEEKTKVKSFDDLSLRERAIARYSSLNGSDVYEQREQAREVAEAELDNIYKRYGNNRNTLTDVYTDFASRKSDSYVDNYRNNYIAEAIADKLKSESNFLTNTSDFIEGTYLGAKGFVSSSIDAGKQAELMLSGNLNADKLTKISQGKLGKDDPEYTKLSELYAKYSNNEKVAELYNVVTNTKKYYIAPIEIQRLTDSVNEIRRADEYNLWKNTYTADDDYDLQRYNLKNELSYDDGLGKALNTAAPVVGNILIPGALGASVGTAVGSTNAIKGMKAAGDIAKATQIVNNVNTAVSLASMGPGVRGTAFNQAISEGANTNEAFAYSILSEALELGTELLGGEKVNALLGQTVATTPMGKLTSKLVNKANIKNNTARMMIGWVSNVGAEATEERISALLEPIIASGTYGKEMPDPVEYLGSVYTSGLESVIPTMILGGFGQVRINHSINKIQQDMTNLITNDPRVSTHLTDAEKAELIKKLNFISENAKIGIEQNYDELEKEVKSEAKAKGYEEQLYEIENDINQKVRTNINRISNLASVYRQDENGNYVLTEDERANAVDYLAEQGRMPVNNFTNKTSQELLDQTKTGNVTYKNIDTINQDLAKLREQNPNVQDIEVVTELSKIDENIKALIDYYIGGTGETVFVRPTTVGEVDYGFTSRDTNNVYVDISQTTKDKIATAWHEIGHQIKLSVPTLYNEFIDKAKITNADIDNYNNQLATPKTPDEVREEMFGDYLGKILSSKQNSNKLEDNAMSLIERLKEIGGKVSNKLTGSEIDNSRLSVYNLDIGSYLDANVLNDKAFENKVMETLRSLKNVDQVKEATKKTKEILKPQSTVSQQNKSEESNAKTPGDDVKTRIEEKYKAFDKKLVNMKTVKEMIANELGVENNDPQVDEIYKQLKKYGEIGERIKLSARKNLNNTINKDVSAIITAPPLPREKLMLRRHMPKTLIKYGLIDMPMKMVPRHIMESILSRAEALKRGFTARKGSHFHEMGKKNFIKAINELDTPSAIYRWKTNPINQYTEKDYIVLTELINGEKGKPERVIVPLILEDQGGYYEIKSVYGKKQVFKYLSKNMPYLDEIYKKRTSYLGGIQSPVRTTSSLSIGNSISSSDENVNPIKNSSRKAETNTEKIINNQRNEIERLSSQADDLKEENKGLKKIIKGLKSTGRQQIRNVQSESNKMLRTGREQELKMRGQLEREGKKYSRLSEVAVDLKFENQLAEKARADGISFPREYKDLFIGLRRAGDSIKDAYNLTRSIFDESQVVNKSIDNSINILKELRNRKIYNKLPNDIKAKINEYANIWTGSRNQSNLTLAKRVLNSLTARELRENGVNLTNTVRNQIMSEEGYGWENGKGSKSLQELFKGSKEVAQAFEQELVKLRQEVADFQARNFLAERTKQLEDTIIKMQDEVSNELGKQNKGFKKNVLKTNSTILNTLMTFKTEIQALMGGNGNTALMKLNDNLQKGEARKKQAVVDIYNILSKFMQRSKGLNYALNTERWSPSLEKSLSNKSAFVDTGMVAYDKNGHKVSIKIPRSMMMSLAMHLLNQDNMSHISGAATKLTTDDSGNTHIAYGKGQGVRIPDETLFRAGKEKEAYDSGVTVRLLEDQVEAIANMLTDEEKAFVKAVGEVFKHTSELINEVSNRIVGYDMATVENYFPIRVWDGTRKQQDITSPTIKKEMYGDALAYMLNPGWLQERVTSFNPIYLENIAEVMNRVVNNVANFYGYAEALRDNNILLHSAMPNGTTFSKSIDDLSSSFMTNYNRLTRFITGQESLKDGKFRGLMAMNTLTFNVGTWLTQPMSFFNTIKYFSGKEFLSSINPANNNVKLNKMIRNYFDEMGINHTKYNDYQVARAFIAMATPNLENRAIGYKIPELNQLFDKTLQAKLGAHGIEAFDNIAVTAIARMMAYSVSLDPNIKFGSEEYFDVLGERLTQVLVETQPEFSQVNRANMFRSSNPVLRMLSLFGTPANQMFNNFAQSTLQLRYEAREGKVSQDAITNLIKSASGIVLSSVLVGLVRALRDSIRAGDDDDTEFVDKWIAQSIVSILGPTLILDDVAQFVMGQTKYGGMSSYDFNTPETTFVNGIQNLGEKILQLGKEDVSPAKKTRDIIRAMGVITPIDTKSMVRIVEALMKFMAPDMYKAYSLQTDSTIYKQWLKNSDTDMATFYEAYTATRPKVLEEKYGYHKADKSKGIKSNLKEAREKALKDVLKDQSEVDKYMEILFDYKN